MRIFFIFLFVLNALFFAWQYYQPAKSEAPIKALPASLKTVQLIGETAVQAELNKTRTAVGAPALKVSSGDTLIEENLSCFTLGPFKDEKVVSQIKSQLAEHFKQLTIRKIEESERHRYWIFIPPLPSRSDAIATSKLLAKQKIKDYYIVRSGNNNNSISLGHFKEKSHADRRVKQLTRLGFNPQMEVIYRSYNLYWLDYEMADNNQQHQALIDAIEVDGVSSIDRSCE